ncbi:universal stress protein [Larkinella soli]|uniref:universal stress protein n=1 Tax=Larkinella soli TaxID=1770527 RepID=UPI000FFBA4C0|nr:universal stress protein [Larkinella soli]
MKTLLVPTDFSGTSDQALLWARFLAKQYQSTLILTHVTQPVIPDTTLPTGEIGAGVLVAQELDEAGEHRLKELAGRLQTEGFSVRAEARFGAVDDEIIAVADELNPDLIVMGRSHFDTFFDRLAGSSATDVAMAAPCPVLVVPAPEEGKATAVQLNRIAYATQLEFDENEILRPVVELARTFGAGLSLIKVRADNQPNVRDDRQYLTQIEREFGRDRLREEEVHADNVTEGLTRYINENQVDMLVMATRERDFLSRLLNPSLTKRMVLNSSIPILVYHAKENY